MARKRREHHDDKDGSERDDAAETFEAVSATTRPPLPPSRWRITTCPPSLATTRSKEEFTAEVGRRRDETQETGESAEGAEVTGVSPDVFAPRRLYSMRARLGSADSLRPPALPPGQVEDYHLPSEPRDDEE
jgi:hypothetical protein